MRICVWILIFLGLCNGCSSPNEPPEHILKRQNQVAEYIDRHHDEYLFRPAVPTWQAPERYAWETHGDCKHARITKEFFRCCGCELNPIKGIEQADGKLIYFYDCGGADRHSLPLRDNKEFIYPILIDLLNETQDQTGKPVVITVGHRCPDHNRYVDASTANSSSKHMIGAEVRFYVQGMENRPEEVIQLLMRYYQKTPKYQGGKDWVEFARYDKETDVSTQPWFNKEIFIKLYRRDEGRDLDNRHPYPYISVQVRYDWDRQERVHYDWKNAHRNYLRW